MEWRDIKGYEGYYQVSDTGLVKAISRIVIFADGRKRNYPEKLLPIKEWFKNGTGYLMVSLTKHHKTKGFSVHRLVAEAFIPNPNNYTQVNHKDENKANNHVDNLEWCNAKYNNRYSNSTKVLQFNKKGGFIKEWNCITDAAEQLKIPISGIVRCCKRQCKSYKGCMWRYSKEGMPNSIEDFEVLDDAKRKSRIYSKKHAEKNRKKLTEKSLEYYHKNSEEINKKRREKYQENKEEKRKYAREYYNNHYKK